MKRSHAHYETHQGNDGQWYWRLRAANGRIVASGEGFTSRWHAERGIRAHHRAAMDADWASDVGVSS